MPTKTILIEPYETYVEQFNDGVKELLQIAPAPKAVDLLKDENEQLAFIKAFREPDPAAQRSDKLLAVQPGTICSWTSRRSRTSRASTSTSTTRRAANEDEEEKASILDEVDFELELIRRDEINVAYILALLGSIAAATSEDEDPAETAAKTKAILDLLGTEARLRSKRELIEEFIASYLPSLSTEEETKDAFFKYWDRKRDEAFDAICTEEGLDPDRFASLMAEYQFSDKEPLTDEIMEVALVSPGVVQRRKMAARIVLRMVEHIETFEENLGDLEAA